MSVPVLFGVQGLAEAIEIGWEDNGIITGGIGLLLLLIGFFRKGKPGTRYSIPVAILAVLASIQVVGCFQRILEINPRAGFMAATDIGIYVSLFGAVLALVGALTRVRILHEPLNELSVSDHS
jgi:asparagine N-glycosylation enzyme membrane subunit Stt3